MKAETATIDRPQARLKRAGGRAKYVVHLACISGHSRIPKPASPDSTMPRRPHAGDGFAGGVHRPHDSARTSRASTSIRMRSGVPATAAAALEYRRAIDAGRPCLIFLADPAAAWPPTQIDRGEAAQRVDAFRAELQKRRLLSFFPSEKDLATHVVTAMLNLSREATKTPAATPATDAASRPAAARSCGSQSARCASHVPMINRASPDSTTPRPHRSPA